MRSFSLTRAFRSAKLRRAFAVASVILATGGLVLYKAPLSAAYPGGDNNNPLVVTPINTKPLTADGKNSVAFGGNGAHGVFSLSHSKVLAGSSAPIFAEVRLMADASEEKAPMRAPISLAVVLDTSGSMSGEKIEDAKRSVIRLIEDMRDEDEIAVIRYSDTSEMIQQLARVGSVRGVLRQRIRELDAGGGTNIPGGLSHGLRALDEAAKGRVKRIVLVSDGLDGTRAQAEQLARTSFSSGITVSSLGIGLDFDETYMGSVAQNGHGNFAFIKDGGSLASFLKRELEQTALTSVDNARIHLAIPAGMRFVAATGADATVTGSDVDLRLGSLFAGDERRVIVELATDGISMVGSTSEIRATGSWNKIGQSVATINVPTLSVTASNDIGEVDRGRDGLVFADATSVIASKRQLEAQSAFARGDIALATDLTAKNEVALGSAAAAAPPAAMPRLAAQMHAYSVQKSSFHTVRPSSAEGKTMTKSGAVNDLDNLNRASGF